MTTDAIASRLAADVVVIPGVPPAARALIWDVFFASRNRGIDLPTHFPWIGQSTGTHCLALFQDDGETVVAALVLRELEVEAIGRCAMVGMVCVAPAWRGHALSTRLLTRAVDLAADQRLAALILWTGQPGIYTGHGFAPDGRDTFGQVTLDSRRPCAEVAFTRGRAAAARGLPPFARQLISIESSAARLVAVDTAQGMALAEWQGPLPAVLDLIEASLPAQWGLNAPADSPIFEELRKRGHACAPLPCAARMVRPLTTGSPIPYISVLDRI